MPKKFSRHKSSNRNKKVAPESAPAPGFSPLVEFLLTDTAAEKPPSTVSGGINLNYKLYHVGGNSYFNGTLTYLNGKTKDASFVPFDEAEGNKIFDAYTVGRGNYDERVIRPHSITYCKHISKYIICYDRFDYSLKDWLPIWLKSNCVKDSSGLPHPVIRTEISKLLKSVSNIHNKGLRHLSLSDISNYVVIDDNWYIINISGTLDKSDLKQTSEIMSDFRGFRDMLKNNVLTDTSWQERNDFLATFDINIHPNRLVPNLVDPAFTKSPCERLQMFSEVHHRWMDPTRKCNLLSNAISNGVFDCYTKGGWKFKWASFCLTFTNTRAATTVDIAYGAYRCFCAMLMNTTRAIMVMKWTLRKR